MHVPKKPLYNWHGVYFGFFYLFITFVVLCLASFTQIHDWIVILFIFAFAGLGKYFLRKKDTMSVIFTCCLTAVALIILYLSAGGKPAFVFPIPQEMPVGRITKKVFEQADGRTVGKPRKINIEEDELDVGAMEDDEEIQSAVGSILSQNDFSFRNDFDLQNLDGYDIKRAVIRATIESSLSDPTWNSEGENSVGSEEKVGESTSSFEDSGVQIFRHDAKAAKPVFELEQPAILGQNINFAGDVGESSLSEPADEDQDMVLQLKDRDLPYAGPRQHSMGDFLRNVDWHNKVLSLRSDGRQFHEGTPEEYQIGDILKVTAKEISLTKGKISGNFANFGDHVELPGQESKDCVGDSCDGDLDFEFACSDDTTLILEMEVLTPNEKSDSCSIQVDNDPIMKWMLSVGKEFHWSRPSPAIQTMKGMHTLRIIGRQDGIQFRKIKISQESKCAFKIVEKDQGSRAYTSCFDKGSDMKSRDDTCAGNMVCAKKGQDGRDFGGCSAHGKPSATPDIHCCTKPPTNMMLIVQENDSSDDFSVGTFETVWSKVEETCTGLVKLKSDQLEEHYASNSGKLKPTYGERKLQPIECLPYTCEMNFAPVCMNTAKIDKAKFDAGYGDICWCEDPKRQIGFPPPGCQCKERLHPKFGVKTAQCDSTELDIAGFNSEDLWCYARGTCDGQMESQTLKENVVKCTNIQEGARIDLTSIGKYTFTGRRREVFKYDVPAQNFLQGTKPLGAILIVLNQFLVPMARIDQKQMHFRVANALDKPQQLTLLYIIPHLEKGKEWNIFAQVSKIEKIGVCSDVTDPRECLGTFESRPELRSDCCLIDDFPEVGKAQCESFKKIQADGLSHKAVCREIGFEATYNHQRMRNYDNKWIAALDIIQQSSIHYYQLPMYALFSDLNLKNPDDLVMHAQTEKEEEPWFFMGFQVPVTVGEINFRSPGPAAVTSSNVTSDRIIRESEGMIVALGFEPCSKPKGCPLNQAYICEHIIEDQMGSYYTVDCDGQVGKYLYWVLPGKERVLKLADIVMDAKLFTKPGLQVHVEKFQSDAKVIADRYQGDPAFPLNGVLNPYSPKCVVAESSERPAKWQVDLGAPTYIDIIRIYFYHNVYLSRVPGFSVKVDGSACSTNVDVAERTYVLEVSCNTQGQILEISTPKNTPLVLCDVQMFLTPKPTCSHEVCAECAPLMSRRRRNHCTKCHKNYILSDNTCHFHGKLLRNDPQTIEAPKKFQYHSQWLVEFTLDSSSKTNAGPLFYLMNKDSRLLSVQLKKESVIAKFQSGLKSVTCEANAPMGKELNIVVEYYKNNFNIVVNKMIKCHKQAQIIPEVKAVSFKNGDSIDGTIRNLVYKPANSGGVRLLGTGQYLVNKMSVAKFYRSVDMKQEFELKFDIYPVSFQDKRHVFRIAPKVEKEQVGKGISCFPCIDMVGPEQRLEISITDAFGLLKTCSPDQMIPTREYTSVRVELENKVMTVKYNGVVQCSVSVSPPQIPNSGVVRIGQNRKLKDALAFISNIIYDDSSSEICPPGFQHVFGNCYRKSTKKMDWESARDYCKHYGGDLGTIHIDGQNLYLQNINGMDAKSMDEDLWIGVASANNGNGMRWVDDSRMLYVNWKDGEESRLDQSSCTSLEPRTGFWIQSSCEDSKHFVCSVPAICPPRFTLRGDKCVKFVSDRMTYSDAQGTCQGLDADLFQYEKYEEITLVNEFANKMQNGVWFGCFDEDHDNCFTKPKQKLLTESSCYGKQVLVSVVRKKKQSAWSIGPCFGDRKSETQHCCLPFGVHEVNCNYIDLSIGSQEFCQASMAESSDMKIYINEFSCPTIVVSTMGEYHECSGLFKKTEKVSGGAAIFESERKMIVHRHNGEWYCGASTAVEDSNLKFTFNKYGNVVGGRVRLNDNWNVFPDLRVQCAPKHECNEAELYSSVFSDFNGVYKKQGEKDGSLLYKGDKGKLYWDADGMWVAYKGSTKMTFHNLEYSFPALGARFDGTIDGNAILNCATTCRNAPGWHDSEGDQYTCEWYSQFNRCNLYGDQFSYMEKTAKQACCACGGGSEMKSSAFVCGDKPAKQSFCATPGMLCKGSICTSENEWQPNPDAKDTEATDKPCADGSCFQSFGSPHVESNVAEESAMSECEECKRRNLQVPCPTCGTKKSEQNAAPLTWPASPPWAPGSAPGTTKGLHAKIEDVVQKINDIKKHTEGLMKLKSKTKKKKKKSQRKMSREDLEEYMKQHQPHQLLNSIEKYKELENSFNGDQAEIRKKFLAEKKRRIREKRREERAKKFAREVADLKAHHKQTVKILDDGAENLEDILDRIKKEHKENMSDLEEQFERSSRFIPKVIEPSKVYESGCCKVRTPCCQRKLPCCQQSIMCCKETKASKRARKIYGRVRKAKLRWRKEIKELLKKMKKQHKDDMKLFQNGADGLRHIVKVMDSRHKDRLKRFMTEARERQNERLEEKKERRERKAARRAERIKMERERQKLAKLRRNRREERKKEMSKYAKMMAEHRSTIREYIEAKSKSSKRRKNRRKKRAKRREKREKVKKVVKKFVKDEEEDRQEMKDQEDSDNKEGWDWYERKGKDRQELKDQEASDNKEGSDWYERKAPEIKADPVSPEGTKQQAKNAVKGLLGPDVNHVIQFDKTKPSVVIDPKTLSGSSQGRLSVLKLFSEDRPEEVNFQRSQELAEGPETDDRKAEAEAVDKLMSNPMRKVKGGHNSKTGLLEQMSNQAEKIHKLFLDPDQVEEEGKAEATRVKEKLEEKSEESEVKTKKAMKKLQEGQKELMDDVKKLVKMKESGKSTKKLAAKVKKEVKEVAKESKEIKKRSRETAKLAKDVKDAESTSKKLEKAGSNDSGVSPEKEEAKMKAEEQNLVNDLADTAQKSVKKVVVESKKKEEEKEEKEKASEEQKDKIQKKHQEYLKEKEKKQKSHKARTGKKGSAERREQREEEEKAEAKEKVEEMKSKAAKSIKSLKKKVKEEVREKVKKNMKKKIKAEVKKVKKEMKKIEKKAAQKVKDASSDTKKPEKLVKELKTLEKEKGKEKAKIEKTAAKALSTASNKEKTKLTREAVELESKKEETKKRIQKVKSKLNGAIKGKDSLEKKKKDLQSKDKAQRNEIANSLLELHREMTARAEKFVAEFSLEPEGRDKEMVDYSEEIEMRLEKLYKRVSGRSSFPEQGASPGDARMKFADYENEEKKRLKKYIKRKLGKLDPKHKTSIEVTGSHQYGEPDAPSAVGEAFDQGLADLWRFVSEDAVAKPRKNWQEATDEYMKALRTAKKRIDALEERYTLLKVGGKRKAEEVEKKSAKEAKDEEKKQKEKAQKESKKATKDAGKKMKKLVSREKKKLKEEAKEMEKALLKKEEKKVDKMKKKLKGEIKQEESKQAGAQAVKDAEKKEKAAKKDLKQAAKTDLKKAEAKMEEKIKKTAKDASKEINFIKNAASAQKKELQKELKQEQKHLKEEVKEAANEVKEAKSEYKEKLDEKKSEEKDEAKKQKSDEKGGAKKSGKKSGNDKTVYNYFKQPGRKKDKKFGYLRTNMNSAKEKSSKSKKGGNKGASESKAKSTDNGSKKGKVDSMMDAVKQVLAATKKLHEAHKSLNNKSPSSDSASNSSEDESEWFSRSGEKTLSSSSEGEQFPMGTEDFMLPLDQTDLDNLKNTFTRRALLDSTEDDYSDFESEVGTKDKKEVPLSKVLKPFVCGVKANLPTPVRKAFGPQEKDGETERRKLQVMDGLRSQYSAERFTYTAVPLEETSVGSCGSLGSLCTHDQMQALNNAEGSCTYGHYANGFFALGECNPQARPDVLHCCETYHVEEYAVSSVNHYGVLAGQWITSSSKVRRIINGVSRASTVLIDIENHLNQMLMLSKNIQPKLELLAAVPGVGTFYERALTAVITFESIIPELLLPIKAAANEANVAREKVLKGLSTHMDSLDSIIDPLKLVGRFLHDVEPWMKQAFRSDEQKQEELKQRELELSPKPKEVALGAWQEFQVADGDYKDYSDDPEPKIKPMTMPKPPKASQQDDASQDDYGGDDYGSGEPDTKLTNNNGLIHVIKKPTTTTSVPMVFEKVELPPEIAAAFEKARGILQAGNVVLEEFTDRLKSIAAPSWLDKLNMKLEGISNKIYRITQWGEVFRILDEADFKVLVPQKECFNFEPKESKDPVGVFDAKSDSPVADSYSEFDSDELLPGDYTSEDGDDSTVQATSTNKQKPVAEHRAEVALGEPENYPDALDPMKVFLSSIEKSIPGEIDIGEDPEGWYDFEIEVLESDQVGKAVTYVEIIENNDAVIQGKNIPHLLSSYHYKLINVPLEAQHSNDRMNASLSLKIDRDQLKDFMLTPDMEANTNQDGDIVINYLQLIERKMMSRFSSGFRAQSLVQNDLLSSLTIPSPDPELLHFIKFYTNEKEDLEQQEGDSVILKDDVANALEKEAIEMDESDADLVKQLEMQEKAEMAKSNQKEASAKLLEAHQKMSETANTANIAAQKMSEAASQESADTMFQGAKEAMSLFKAARSKAAMVPEIPGPKKKASHSNASPPSSPPPSPKSESTTSQSAFTTPKPESTTSKSVIVKPEAAANGAPTTTKSAFTTTQKPWTMESNALSKPADAKNTGPMSVLKDFLRTVKGLAAQIPSESAVSPKKPNEGTQQTPMVMNSAAQIPNESAVKPKKPNEGTQQTPMVMNSAAQIPKESAVKPNEDTQQTPMVMNSQLSLDAKSKPIVVAEMGKPMTVVLPNIPLKKQNSPNPQSQSSTSSPNGWRGKYSGFGPGSTIEEDLSLPLPIMGRRLLDSERGHLINQRRRKLFFANELTSLKEYGRKANGKDGQMKKGIAFERDGQRRGVRKIGTAVAKSVKAVGRVVSKVHQGVERQSRHVFTHVKMSARWIGHVVAMLGKYLTNGHRCLIPTPESANVMEIIEMTNQILEDASVIAMPFKVSIEILMKKMLASLGLMRRFPAQEFEQVEKIFPEGLMDDLITASKLSGSDAIWNDIKSLKATVTDFLARNDQLHMPRKISNIFDDLLGDGADYRKNMLKASKESKTLAPDQTGLEKAQHSADSPKPKEVKAQVKKTENDLKSELEMQISDCRQQLDALTAMQSQKPQICRQLPTKLRKACMSRLDSKFPDLSKSLSHQCKALDDLYIQNFVEGEVADSVN